MHMRVASNKQGARPARLVRWGVKAKDANWHAKYAAPPCSACTQSKCMRRKKKYGKRRNKRFRPRSRAPQSAQRPHRVKKFPTKKKFSFALSRVSTCPGFQPLLALHVAPRHALAGIGHGAVGHVLSEHVSGSARASGRASSSPRREQLEGSTPMIWRAPMCEGTCRSVMGAAQSSRQSGICGHGRASASRRRKRRRERRGLSGKRKPE